jgi:hypothetical protein
MAAPHNCEMKFFAIGLLAASALSGCVSAPPAAEPAPAPVPTPAIEPGPSASPATAAPASPAVSQQRYRCDQNFDFSVRFTDDSAVIDAGSRGNDVLLRDAGGVTPQQTVYSNPRLRAEFGLGASGSEAILRYLAPQLVVNCVKD